MKNLGNYFVSAMLLAGSSTMAWAEENEAIPATFSVQFSGLEWSQTKTKFSDESGDREVTSLNTGDLVDSMIWATVGRMNLYFYPFQDSNALVSLSYMVRDDLEVGLDLGLNASKRKDPKSELSSDLFGAFLTWSVPVGNSSLENLAIFDVTRSEATEINETTLEEETSKVSGTFLKFSTTIVVPIAKNAWYMAGVWIASENVKYQTEDTTQKSTQFGLNLAGLRLTLD